MHYLSAYLSVSDSPSASLSTLLNGTLNDSIFNRVSLSTPETARLHIPSLFQLFTPKSSKLVLAFSLFQNPHDKIQLFEKVCCDSLVIWTDHLVIS